MPFRLHAVIPLNGHGDPPLPTGVRTIAYRDLGAVVSVRDKFAMDEVDPMLMTEHRQVVDAVFRDREVLPTPAGIVFRTEQVLTRWMELHYVALTDALGFVGDRYAARVHVSRPSRDPTDREAGSDLAEAASAVFRDLRRRAVASVPLTLEQVTGLVLTGAFLVERDLWKDFERAFADVREANPDYAVEMTGPWAPYDFVRMSFVS